MPGTTDRVGFTAVVEVVFRQKNFRIALKNHQKARENRTFLFFGATARIANTVMCRRVFWAKRALKT